MWLQRYKLTISSSECLRQAIRLADVKDVQTRSSLYRKLLTNTLQLQVGQIIEEIESWVRHRHSTQRGLFAALLQLTLVVVVVVARCVQLKELNGMRGVKGHLHKKYPTVEAEWLVNFCWNHGALAYRSELPTDHSSRSRCARIDLIGVVVRLSLDPVC